MPADNREKAFIDVCSKNEIEYFIKKYDIDTYNQMNYYDYIKAALNEIEGVDGIFASSDLIAAQVIQVCNEIKIRIPEDIKLVGFDDVDISQLTTPRITTVHLSLIHIFQALLEDLYYFMVLEWLMDVLVDI